jgi:outer membrane lipoprotein carrier protein
MKNTYFRHLAIVIIGVMVGVFSQQLLASTGIDHLDRFFQELKTFRADFSQVVLDENLTPLEESTGRLWISRPNRFRWNYQGSFPQQIIADGSKVWVYDVELEQVTVRSQEIALDGTPAVLLAGQENLELDYDIQDLGLQGSVFWVVLQPKASDGSFSEVQLGFQENTLRQIQVLDNLSHITRIVLTHVEENPTISADRFNFTVPAGVDLIGNGL